MTAAYWKLSSSGTASTGGIGFQTDQGTGVKVNADPPQDGSTYTGTATQKQSILLTAGVTYTFTAGWYIRTINPAPMTGQILIDGVNPVPTSVLSTATSGLTDKSTGTFSVSYTPTTTGPVILSLQASITRTESSAIGDDIWWTGISISCG